MTFPVPTAALLATCVLMTAMAAKHFLADFVLQTDWMARGKERVDGWVLPLAAHAGIHALGTLLVALAVRPTLWWLALVDFLVHGLVDRGKALTSQRARWQVTDARFWWLLGFDQLLHQLTNIGLVAALLLP